MRHAALAGASVGFWGGSMKLCFLVEEQYRHDGMPLDVIRQLDAWGHQVDVVWPGRSLIRISEFT